MNLSNYLALSAVLFSIGAATVLLRRNAIIVFLGIELMLNASNLAFVTFARIHGDLTGQVVAFFVMVVAAAEVEPRLGPYVGPYVTMAALPATLTPVEPLARAVFRGGWRPPHAEGPSRDRLVEILDAAHSAAA